LDPGFRPPFGCDRDFADEAARGDFAADFAADVAARGDFAADLVDRFADPLSRSPLSIGSS
jgi:hypothetical protein